MDLPQNDTCFDMTLRFIKLGDYPSEKLRLVHGVEATENQTLKIGFAWEIKRLVKQFDNIFYDTPIWMTTSNMPQCYHFKVNHF
jgi:hypothetical protein